MGEAQYVALLQRPPLLPKAGVRVACRNPARGTGVDAVAARTPDRVTRLRLRIDHGDGRHSKAPFCAGSCWSSVLAHRSERNHGGEVPAPDP